MDEKKAIERINRFMMWMSDGTKKALHLSVKALERQIPNKPLEKHYEDEGEQPYIKYKCPSCDNKYQITKDYDEYCNKCGQKINWD